jgi:hypothetical protein
MIWHLLSHIFGLDDLTGPWYGFWSGLGSDLGELAIVGGLISLYLRHNCHAKGCWRIGRHPVAGTPYIVCRKHHPNNGPTAESIAQEHADA